MAKSFAHPAAFRRSLEDRLRSTAAQRSVSLDSLRLKLVMERLLARLFAEPHPPWLLKGGFALELRYRPRARTTRDVDLAITTNYGKTAPGDHVETLQEALRTAASRDLGDHLTFTLSEASRDLQGAPQGGARFRCECRLAGTTYAVFSLDAGFGDPTPHDPEILVGSDILAFAGFKPPVILAVPITQQFAEKMHAYTFPWVDRANTRTKDLVDILLLLDSGLDATPALREALSATFDRRATHPLPTRLEPPPNDWQLAFTEMAVAIDLPQQNLEAAYRRLAGFWQELFAAVTESDR